MTPKKSLTTVLAGCQANYRLMVCYSLELQHSLMGYFPAVVSGTERIILVSCKDLLRDVWQALPPKKAKVNLGLCHVNTVDHVAFPILDDLERTLSNDPELLMSRGDFASLSEASEQAFSWAPGLLGSGQMSGDSYNEFIDRSIAELPD